MFLDKTGTLVPNRDTWIPADIISDILTLEINITNADPYIFRLEGDRIIDPYYAMCYQNLCETWKILDDVVDFYVAGDDLFITRSTGVFKATPIRTGFLHDDLHVYIPFLANKMELIYD